MSLWHNCSVWTKADKHLSVQKMLVQLLLHSLQENRDILWQYSLLYNTDSRIVWCLISESFGLFASAVFCFCLQWIKLIFYLHKSDLLCAVSVGLGFCVFVFKMSLGLWVSDVYSVKETSTSSWRLRRINFLIHLIYVYTQLCKQVRCAYVLPLIS